IYTHTWSLGVEEHSYILLGIGAVFVARRPARLARLPAVYVVVALAMLAMRVAEVPLAPLTDGYVHAFPTHLRAEPLLFGVVLSYAYKFAPDRLSGFVQRFTWPLAAAAAAGFATTVLVPDQSLFMITVGYPLVYLGYGALLLLVVHGKTPLDGRLGAVL